MTPPHIRRASSEDLPEVRECVDSAYRPYIERIGGYPAPMLEDYGSLAEAGELWVLLEDGTVAGVLVMRPEESGIFIENIAVKPSLQGEGFGLSLMTFAEEKAIEMRLQEIRLYTNEKMWQSLAFYESLGFEETDRRPDEGYQRVFLRKCL